MNAVRLPVCLSLLSMLCLRENEFLYSTVLCCKLCRLCKLKGQSMSMDLPAMTSKQKVGRTFGRCSGLSRLRQKSECSPKAKSEERPQGSPCRDTRLFQPTSGSRVRPVCIRMRTFVSVPDSSSVQDRQRTTSIVDNGVQEKGTRKCESSLQTQT